MHLCERRRSLCQNRLSIDIWTRCAWPALFKMGTGTCHISCNRSQLLPGADALHRQRHLRVPRTFLWQLVRHPEQSNRLRTALLLWTRKGGVSSSLSTSAYLTPTPSSMQSEKRPDPTHSGWRMLQAMDLRGTGTGTKTRYVLEIYRYWIFRFLEQERVADIFHVFLLLSDYGRVLSILHYLL